MTGTAANTVWARAILDELARCGLRDVVVAPGSRSTPLVMAAHADERLRVRVHLDERSAGFFALGLGKAGRPAAVVTTSGTAVANLLPAVVEAAQASVPLVVLTADRPPRLRGADANQAIDQHGIFGRYPRAFHELSLPSMEERALTHLRSLACRAWGDAVGGDPGPVHLNVPFDKPLEPAEPTDEERATAGRALDGRPDGAPWTAIAHGVGVLPDEELQRLAVLLSGDRPVLVAGPSASPAVGAAAVAAARRFGCPLLADPLSGARYRGGADALGVSGYDLFLRDPDIRAALAPTGIVRVGRSPVSAGLQRWLFEHADVPQGVIDPGVRYKDHGATADAYLVADAAAALDALTAEAREGDVTSWTRLWRDADRAVRDVTQQLDADCEGAVLAAVYAEMPEDGTLFVSNSMPIRDLDAFGHPSDRSVRVLANRGASGIDGVVSTAFGVSTASQGPTVCVIGDLALFHDSNGLLWAREDDAPVVFVLVDNDGGGIFQMLPISEHEPEFTSYFATPHGLDFEHLAALHRLSYRRVEPSAVGTALRDALTAGGSQLLHLRTDRATTHRLRSDISESVIRRVGAVVT